MVFQLYKQLVDKLDKEYPSPLSELSEQEKMYITNTIKKLTDREHEYIYALIRSYQVDESIIYPIPFSGKQQKKGIKFDLANFPLRLQYIVLLFIHLHNSSIETNSVQDQLM